MSKPFTASAHIRVGNVEVLLTLPVAPAAPGAPAGPSAPPTHGRRFEFVRWGGKEYCFSPMQRAVVAALWQAREQGHEWVLQDALLECADSDCGRVRDLFRGHPAWGTLIVHAVDVGGPPGSYRLAPADSC